MTPPAATTRPTLALAVAALSVRRFGEHPDGLPVVPDGDGCVSMQCPHLREMSESLREGSP